jgi:putative tricarboxylic transport membrane protein
LRLHDTLIGAVLLGLAAFIFCYALTIPPMRGQQYGADVFPILVSIGLTLFSVLLIVRGWQAHKPGDRFISIAPWAADPYTRGNFVLAIVAIIVYVVLDDYLGFIPMSIAILVTLFVRQGVSWKRSVLVAVVATLAIQYLFGNLLRVPLPRGLLTDYWW